MTSKERVRLTFQHRAPDRVPVFEQSVCSAVASEVLGRSALTGGGSLRRGESEAWLKGEAAHAEFVATMIDDVAALVKTVDFDLIRMPWRHTERPTKKLDETTYLYGDPKKSFSIYRYDESSDIFDCSDDAVKQRGAAAIQEQVEAMEKSLANGWTPDAQALLEFDLLTRKAGTDRYVCAPCGGLAVPFHAEWLAAMIEGPELIHRYLNGLCEMNLIAMRQYASHGADCFWAGGDLADNRGVVYGPKAFREFLLPPLKRIIALADQLGKPYVFRTDGDTYSIADMLFLEAGVHGYGEIDVDAGMDLMKLRTRYPKLTLWGGMSCGKVLVDGTEAQIRNEVQRLIHGLAGQGGYILGSSNSIHSGVPAKNFIRMLAAARETSIPV